MPKEKSFQDYFPGNNCYGCGPANKDGVHVTKSRWLTSEHRETMCNWKIRKKYNSAVSGLHGGTSATLLDCHSIWTAIAARYDLEQRAFASNPIIFYVTRHMEIDFLKPVTMETDMLSVISKVEELKADSRACILFSEIVARGIVCVTARVVAVRIELPEEAIHGLLKPPQKNKPG